MLTTSYFSNLKNVANPLSISGKAPDWYTGPQFKVLAPKYGFFMAYKNGEIDSAGYTECFNAQVLDPLDPQTTYDRIIQLAGPDATLLCYEKPGDFCHRRIVAGWFETHLKIIVPELIRSKTVRNRPT
jgi:hypothetical protein